MISLTEPIDTTLDGARQRDAQDALAAWRAHFYLPPGQLYFDGNSLGLLSREAEAAVLAVLDEWKRLAIAGWLSAPQPWYTLGERLGQLSAPLVGAAPDEVVVTGTTTVNLHALLATFYQPRGARRRIVATALDFPSDLYAFHSQLALRGGDPASELSLVASRDGRTIEEADIIAALDERVALLIVPSVLYRSGQLLDLARLAAAAHERGVLIGVDCCHSIGVVPHAFAAWAIDFACWCNYKYLNNGPGGTAGLYVSRRHFGQTPGLAGWWGSHKARQFDMAPVFDAAPDAGAWQISTIQVLSAAPLLGSLQLFAYLMDLLSATGLTAPAYGYTIGTPRRAERRGGHVALEHAAAAQIVKALKARGVVPDFRPPNVIRLAPIALYTSFSEVWQLVDHLRQIVDHGEYQRFAAERDLVT